MKFLANENIPFELIDDLRKSGYDILRVDEVKKGMRDHEVLDKDRILLIFEQIKDLEGKFIVLEENILRVREIKGDI